MYFVKTPFYLKSVYPSLIWDIKKENTLYLTFDDGPIPEITEEVLQILADFKVQATFFCIGENVKQNPAIYERIIDNNHAIGNHTFKHLNGWKSELDQYINDVNACHGLVSSTLFRPPYGRIGFQQIQDLKKHYKIIMWDVLSGDFDTEIDAEKCTKNVLDNVSSGSIIVFHDSIKAKQRVLKSLPVVLDQLLQQGYHFEKIPE